MYQLSQKINNNRSWGQ